MAGIGEAASVITAIEISGKILSSCSKYYSGAKGAQKDVERLQNEVESFNNILNETRKLLEGPNPMGLPVSNTLSVRIKECMSDLEGLRNRLEPGKGRKTMRRIGLQTVKWPFTSRDVDRSITMLNRQKGALHLALSIDQRFLTLDIDENVTKFTRDGHLSKLPYALGDAYDSHLYEHEPLCFPDTRVDVLHQLLEWSRDRSGKCIFWLTGMSGTGKSTIARTIARAFAKQKCLGASFFFARGRGDRGHARMFFSTLAVQLANVSPTLSYFICQAIAEDHDIPQQALRDQWEKLIFQPMSKWKDDQPRPPLVLVIDALDECEHQSDIRLILRLFSRAKDLNTIQLRIFLTSRPEMPIRLGFHAIPSALYQNFILRDISETVVEHDISIFVSHELKRIKAERGTQAGWPGEQNIKLLVQRAECLFTYAATACRFIGDPKWVPEERLSVVLQGDPGVQSPTLKLDEMYTQILKQSVIGDSDEETLELSKIFRQIVGYIVILFDSLSSTTLSKLLSLPARNVDQILGLLHSVLDVPESQDSPIRLLHPSFRDFLLSRQRRFDKQIAVDETMAHGDIMKKCLTLMSEMLNKNICSLQTSDSLVSGVEDDQITSCLPVHLQYACLYWIDHLQRGEISLCNDNGPIHEFLQQHFLHWLEALSLIGKMSEGVLMVRRLQTVINPSENPELFALIHDANRFMLYNRSIIEEAPLRTYSSALIFSPRMSKIRSHFWNEIPAWIKRAPVVEEQWSSSLQTLQDHAGAVYSVAFSPDGKLLASASADRTIRLWDPTTGALYNILEGHTGYINAVIFSPDNQLLASASSDETVRLWNSETGTLCSILSGHTYSVKAVVFSPDGQLLGSASCDRTVRLWCLATGASYSTLRGHKGYVNAVAFSPDDKLLASASADHTVRLWDLAAETLYGVIEGHTGSVNAVVFSPDGKLLASASDDHTVRLWDPAAQALCGVFEGHTDSVQAVAFSPDGQLLASTADSDHTVRLWNPATRTSCGILKGHSNFLQAVAFSPDSQLLASASFDHTIRLWDTAIEASCSTLEDRQDPGHTGSVNAMAFSPDGKLLASVSDECIVRLWDPATEASCGVIEGHTGWVNAVAFSPDGKLLASASDDCTVRLWDPATGISQGRLEGHTAIVWAVAFSPNGGLLASASSDLTVRLWDVKMKETIETIETTDTLGAEGPIISLSFSSDGSYLQTSIGKLKLKTLTGCEIQLQVDSTHPLSVNEHWITWRMKNILWLPPDYRPSCVAVCCVAVWQNLLAIGHSSGRISFIEVDPDRLFDECG